MKYEISNGTLAIVPEENEKSLIYEDEEKYVVDEVPFKIMEDSCKYFGSSYNGRKESARDILGAEYKVPIIVEDSDNLIVFPTTSPAAADCVWISLKRLKKFEKVDGFNTRIIFDNNKEIIENFTNAINKGLISSHSESISLLNLSITSLITTSKDIFL